MDEAVIERVARALHRKCYEREFHGPSSGAWRDLGGNSKKMFRDDARAAIEEYEKAKAEK